MLPTKSCRGDRRSLPRWRAGGIDDGPAYLAGSWSTCRLAMAPACPRDAARSPRLEWLEKSPDLETATAERDRTLRAVMRLPVRRRAVVVLRFYDDLPEARIAEVLGISTATVKSQLSRASSNSAPISGLSTRYVRQRHSRLRSNHVSRASVRRRPGTGGRSRHDRGASKRAEIRMRVGAGRRGGRVGRTRRGGVARGLGERPGRPTRSSPPTKSPAVTGVRTTSASTSATSHHSTTVPASTSTSVPALSTWTAIAPDRVERRSTLGGVDRERGLVVGGVDPGGEPRPAAAAYDPLTDTWRTLADPPPFGSHQPARRWTGTDMLLIGGDNPTAVCWCRTARPTTRPPTCGESSRRLLSDSSPPVRRPRGPAASCSCGRGTVVARRWRSHRLPTTPPRTVGASSPRQRSSGASRPRRFGLTEWIVWGGTTGVGSSTTGRPTRHPTRGAPSDSPLSPRRVRGCGGESWSSSPVRRGRARDRQRELALSDVAAYDTSPYVRRSLGPAHPGLEPM